MGDYSYLYIGENEFYAWKYELPPRNEPILSLIFDETDKKIVNTSNKLHEYRILENSVSKKFTCRYDVEVRVAIERLNSYGFTIKGLIEIISNLTGIPIKNVSLALRNALDFSARFLAMRREVPEMERRALHKMESAEISYDKYANIIAETELGYLPEIFMLRSVLESLKPTDKVVLDLHEIIDYGSKSKATKDYNDISLFSEGTHSKISLRRRYLYESFVHFSTRQIDLVYIDLIIALEASLKTYLSSSSRRGKNNTGGIKIDTFLKDVSLVNATIFVVKYLKKKDLSVEQVKRLEEIYNIRNNVMHGGMKNFDLTRIHPDVQLITEIINQIGNKNSRNLDHIE